MGGGGGVRAASFSSVNYGQRGETEALGLWDGKGAAGRACF